MNNIYILGSSHLLNKPKTKTQDWLIYKQNFYQARHNPFLKLFRFCCTQILSRLILFIYHSRFLGGRIPNLNLRRDLGFFGEEIWAFDPVAF